MKVKLLKATTFRGQKLKKDAVVEVPDGLGNLMISNSEAVKVS